MGPDRLPPSAASPQGHRDRGRHRPEPARAAPLPHRLSSPSVRPCQASQPPPGRPSRPRTP